MAASRITGRHSRFQLRAGKADINVFRLSSGIWYRLNSSTGSFFAVQYGIGTDKPTEAAYVPVQ